MEIDERGTGRDYDLRRKKRRQSMAKFCTSCGTKLADDAIFCTNCGKRQEKLSSVLQAESDGGLKPAPGPSMADAKPQPVAAEMKTAEKTPESVHRPSSSAACFQVLHQKHLL